MIPSATQTLTHVNFILYLLLIFEEEEKLKGQLFSREKRTVRKADAKDLWDQRVEGACSVST